MQLEPVGKRKTADRTAPSNEGIEELRTRYEAKAKEYEQFYAKLHNEAWGYFLPEGTFKSVLAAAREGSDESERYRRMMLAQAFEAARFYHAFTALNEGYRNKQAELGVMNPQDLQTEFSSVLRIGKEAIEGYGAHASSLLNAKSKWNEI
ncbi:hypothetical protein A3A39_02565 [Candidatus Kaiserbacteria bacterium RIFCSPLOWO2_01_FULL_54_13]|uniref:Uncharacterized protein n=1 Tax=Candidatus Kaiserbacteria bacterium RIFCSPLOWO2_01_FULL_54_13 TaxID=1798512 RepID=A0A1F6F3J2_9BACT|nr:MAG: hypothetical protein A3A39_02565 [Candidatus Kaiserbacteria bacterium RIFCSPLOWO2_01_FULL_54_13]